MDKRRAFVRHMTPLGLMLRGLPLLALAALLMTAGGIRHAGSVIYPAGLTSSSSEPAAVGTPKRLLIPSLKVDVPLEEVGITAEGAMDIPKDASIPGWYKGGVRPGMKGNAVIAGHRDSAAGTPGVFVELAMLKIGDEVRIEDLSGNVHRFRVTDVQTYDARTSPMEKIFGPGSKPMLQLITCVGPWNEQRKQYNDRLVVYTELIPHS
jgi:sortase A